MLCLAVLHELAEQEKRGGVRNTDGLLHVVGHDDDRVLLAQLRGQVFNLGGGDGVERTRRLVHQKHLRLDGKRPRDTEPLLLAAGEAERIFLEPVLDLVPDGRAAQGFFYDVVKLCLVADAVRSRTVGDVVVDAHGEGVRLLEDHADALAELVHIHGRIVNVFTLVGDLARDFHAAHEVVHPVERL